MMIIFAVCAVGALALCGVAQVQAAREETARLEREQEELAEKYGGFQSGTPYR